MDRQKPNPGGGGTLRWAAAVALTAAAWQAAGGRAGGPAGRRAPPVTEIRFGVLEPPVVAQRDITVRYRTSNQQPEEKPLECSSIAWADGQVILTSDRHGHVLFSCAMDLEKMTIEMPRPHVIIRNEQLLLDDAECIALGAPGRGERLAYVLCSLSNDREERPLPQRRHFVRLALQRAEPFAAGPPTVLKADPVRDALQEHFQAVGVSPYRTYYGGFHGANKNTYRWANVEGMTFTPDGKRLLCGMRNPLLGGRAICFALEGVAEAFDARDPGRIKVTDLFALDLGQRGVSELCWDPVTRGYLIAAARSNGPRKGPDHPYPPNTLDSALFWWSGRKRDRPVQFAAAPDMTVEAICRLGGSRYIAIGSDEGDVSEGRGQRQSVLTILDFTGLAGRRQP